MEEGNDIFFPSSCFHIITFILGYIEHQPPIFTPRLPLNDGSTIPCIGLGTYRGDNESLADLVYFAISKGFVLCMLEMGTIKCGIEP